MGEDSRGMTPWEVKPRLSEESSGAVPVQEDKAPGWTIHRGCEESVCWPYPLRVCFGTIFAHLEELIPFAWLSLDVWRSKGKC